MRAVRNANDSIRRSTCGSGALVGPELQTPGHARVGLGERRAHPAQVVELVPVVAQQVFVPP